MTTISGAPRRPSPGRRSLLAAAALGLATTALASTALGGSLALEKDELRLGFIKLTDMAPLAIAYEKGFFEDEGLYVTLEPQANWKVLLDGVITGALDGAHMLSGQALAATIGFGTEAHLITPFVLDLNGNATTVSNAVWEGMKPHLDLDADRKPVHPISAAALRPVIEDYELEGRSFNMGMVFPVSTHNYELRYWLAAGGVHPGYYSADDTSGQIAAEAFLSVTPPPQMPATLEAGTIDGYSVGEPWNQAAVFNGIGVPVVTDYDIFKDRSEKVLGITAQFAEDYPNTTLAMVRALIRATQWLDENDNANRIEAVRILSRPEYVGADAQVIANSMTGTFEYEKGDIRPVPDFNVFFRYYANYPYYSDAVWYLTQMRRWGQITADQSDEWYAEIAKSVYRPDIYLEAARSLLDEGVIEAADVPWDSDGYRAPFAEAIDGVVFDARQPNDYIDSFAIGLKTGQAVVGAGVVDAD